jgi:hypothetical protein
MEGKFIIRMRGEDVTYANYNNIPDQIGAVIEYKPNIPEPPHTDEEHELIHTFQDKLQKLVQRESCQLR